MNTPRDILRLGLLAATLSFAMGHSGTTLAAEEAESSFGGQDPGAGTRPVPATGLFDRSVTFVPPEQLPIVDVYEKDYRSLSEAALMEELEAVSVTPEGEIESLPVTREELMLMRSAIGALESGAEGGRAADPGNSDLAEGEMTAESVIGSDTRTRITNTTRYPYRTMGRIDIGCTGTLIGKRHVLTAGHCVYNIKTDQWYSQLSFSPGQNGSSRPYGKIGWKRAVSVKGWTRDHKRDYDYAMIVLSKDVGDQVGWLGYGWKNPLPKYNVNINGYPGDKPSGTLWHAYCQLQLVQTRRLYYSCDTFNGMSGSGVYVYFSSTKKRTIYGIHAYGVDSTGKNGATRITESVFNNLKKWKSTY